MKSLAIYGAGALGREILDLALRVDAAARRWSSFLFCVDSRYLPDDPHPSLSGYPVVGFESLRERYAADEIEVVIANGEPAHRDRMLLAVRDSGLGLATLVDPSALVSSCARLGPGVVVCSHAFVATGSSIGENVLIQPACILGHDTIVGRSSVLSTGFAPGGGLHVGDRVFVGMSCSALQGLSIGSDAVVGMGSVVYKDVPEGMVAVGNPARVVRRNEDGKIF